MQRITANQVLIRFTLRLVATLLAASALVFWCGGFGKLLEYINDLF
jgi:hypothetical protein